MAVGSLLAQDTLLPVLHFDPLSTANGLPSNYVRSRIVRDDLGFVWIGTINGLVRYDGNTARVYGPVEGDTHSLASRTVNSILQDSKGRLWIGGWERGLSLYDRARDRFINFAPGFGTDHTYHPAPTTALYEDRAGDLWLGTEGSGAVHVAIPDAVGDLDSLAAQLRFTSYPLSTPRNSAADIYQRTDGTVLIASDRGVLLLSRSSSSASRIPAGDPLAGHVDSIAVQRFLEDSRGNFWVASATRGVYLFDPDGNNVRTLRHRAADPRSISSDNVWDVAEAPDGWIWMGTQKGVDIVDPSTFTRLQHLSSGASPGMSALIRVSFDRTGIAWIGTAGDGVYRWSPRSLRIPHYSLGRADGRPRGFSNVERSRNGTLWLVSEGVAVHLDPVTRRVLGSIDVFRGKKPVALYGNNNQALLDGDSILWLGTWGLGLFRIDLASRSVRNYLHDSPYGRSGIALSVARSNDGSIWAAGYSDGLLEFDTRTGHFRRVPTATGNLLQHLMMDRTGQLWLASETQGVGIYDPGTGIERQYTSNPADSGSINQNRTRATFQDPQGRIWVGAGHSVNLWDSATGTFKRFTNRHYPDALWSLPVGTDPSGRLWISLSFGGLSVFDPSSRTFTNLVDADGTCGYVTDMENLPDGRVILAGDLGVNMVSPDIPPLNRPPPSLLFTRLAINDVSVPPPRLAKGAAALALSPAENTLEVEFAALDMETPHAVEYRYRLVGLESDWVRPSGRRYVRYASLPPGKYELRVAAASRLKEWADQEIVLTIDVAAPWWRTPWAYAAYGLLALALLYGSYRLRLNRFRLEQKAAMEHLQAERLAEMDRMKSRFFANISHEFRTPLTLILGPIRDWKARARNEAEAIEFGHAERNAHRLLGLVNQLLDLSKLEAGAMHVRARRINVVPVIKGIAYSFESSAGIRGISLSVVCQPGEIEAYVDRDMLEKILTNLIANAFKFTPEGGSVEVTAGAIGGRGAAGTGISGEAGSFEVRVRDSGIGIPPDELPRIFERFYQVDNSQTRAFEGSGIGLAVVKELVELHHGSIEARSEPGRGSEFIVRLPLGREHFGDEEIATLPVPPSGPATSTRDARTAASDSEVSQQAREASGSVAEEDEAVSVKPVVLVVEDSADVRAYIRGHLLAEYHVLEAANGVEGLERAREEIPDLVISDVMMPRMDGYQICRALKEDEKTSHVPVILLTAKAGTEDRIEGLETGADDYLIKPFEPKELVARVRNLIETRRKLRELMKVPLRPSDIVVTSMDDAFLKKAIEAVEQHMGEEGFRVEDLGAHLAMSRVQLHRKITALTNHPPGEFIRYLRLHRAMELLKSDAGTVSEIAYSVGFGDPSHFTRRFRELFGVLPSEVRGQP